MQTYHGEAIVNPEGNIVVALPFRIGEKVEVVVIPSDEKKDDASWKDLAAAEFLKGYSEEDAAYDNYNA
jgi:hypothetical protein